VDACHSLTTEVTLEEVRRAIMSIKAYKSLGLDGFQPFFFKMYWEIMKKDFWDLVHDTFKNGFYEDKIVETLIVLVPKIDHPKHFKDFKPISLCNVIYKIITKVIVQRLRPFLDELISPLYGSFIPSHGTIENAIVAQEIIYFMNHSKAKKGNVAFKTDLEKAYHRVSWDYLKKVLHDFGFPQATISLIMWCTRASSLFVLWNGARTNFFKPTKGLRKEDPLSPYLFVIYIEKLSIYIQ